MAIKKSQLYSTLWESCNALRGGMDASQYKDYVLVVLFLKYISDRQKAGYIDEIPEDCTFDYVVKHLKNQNDIGDQLNKKLERIAKEFNMGNVFVNADFANEDKLGKGKELVETVSSLIEIFENPNLDFTTNRAGNDDLIGDAYEYLMRNFATQSGKSKGQFYTPAEVSRLMAKLIGIDKDERDRITIYDCACGSGSLLLRAKDEAIHAKVVGLYGQEKDLATYNMAEMNIMLHGIQTFDLQHGDTLNSPQHLEGGLFLQTFDYGVANPPFSLKGWMKTAKADDVFGRWSTERGVPPASKGDYAFLLHMVKSLKSEGKGAVILPHGVLFRGNAERGESEAVIRRDLINSHIIKGIIGLPSNLFYGTGIPACIIIIDKSSARDSKGILMIDAKDGFLKDGAKNRLREQDIRRIADVWDAGKDNPDYEEPHFARFVKYEEIERNGWNLNIPRYVQPRDTEVHQDLYAHLNGGIPQTDIDALDTLWNTCPSLREKLFTTGRKDGYMQFTDAAAKDLSSVIEDDASYQEQQKTYDAAYSQWRNYMREAVETTGEGCVPKQVIKEWSSHVLTTFSNVQTLVDGYAVYDELMKYWEDTMQDDLYMISRDGWNVTFELPRDKKGNVKKTYGYDEIQCDLLPSQIIASHYFSEECQQIEHTKQEIEALSQVIDTTIEEFADYFDDFGDSVKPATLKAALKEAKNSPADYDKQMVKAWEDVNGYYAEIDKQKKLLKEMAADLTKKVREKYGELTEEDVRQLVFEDKWMQTLRSRFQTLMTTEQQKIITTLTALNERYADTLPELEMQVDLYRRQVQQHLKEMGIEIDEEP